MLSIECEFCIYLLDRYYTALTNSCDRSFFCKFCRLLFLTTCFSQIIVLSNFLQIGVLDTFFCKLSFWPTFFCKLSFCTTFFVNCCPGQLFSCRWSFWPYFWELLFRTSFSQIVVPDNYFANCHSSSFFF